jgi:hypothetical protein
MRWGTRQGAALAQIRRFPGTEVRRPRAREALTETLTKGDSRWITGSPRF